MKLEWKHDEVGYETDSTLRSLCEEFTMGCLITYGAIERLCVCVKCMSEATVRKTKQSALSERHTLPHSVGSWYDNVLETC